MVTAGDPVQDLAWYLLIDRHHHEAFGVPRLSGLPDRVTSIERWERAAGRSADHLGWYELLGALRYALVVSRVRSEEHTSELQSLMRISYAVFCLTKKTKYTHT